MISQELQNKAIAHFHEGYNCAQSVLLTMTQYWGINDDLVPKIATAFGSGMGRCGSVCGALTGGVMALSAKFGSNEPSARRREKTYALAQKLYRRFEDRNGTVLCKELLGHDLSVPEQLERVRRGVYSTRNALFSSETSSRSCMI